MNAVSLTGILGAPLAQVRQAFAWAWGGGHGPWGWWSCPFFGGWGASWPGVIMTYGFWGLVIALLILLIRRLALGGRVNAAEAGRASQAIEILKQRYAKGEITAEEFRGIMNDLR
ncbi:MAG: SHOCT domain-containing protein [Desulfobacteraceae bacterium]|nr:MAG: SHOCT domain-containing protein [Desulfobacteraceae bacterium]